VNVLWCCSAVCVLVYGFEKESLVHTIPTIAWQCVATSKSVWQVISPEHDIVNNIGFVSEWKIQFADDDILRNDDSLSFCFALLRNLHRIVCSFVNK